MSVQYVQHTFSYFLNSMQKAGVKNVDMWGGSPHYCRFDFHSSFVAARQIARLKEEIVSRGMKVVIYTPETLAYPFSYSAPDSALRERTLEYMKLAIDDALEFGTEKVFINAGCHPRDLDREDGWKRLVESYQQLCGYASRMGVRLVLEQLQPYESNLLVSLKDMKRMFAEIDSAALCACVDLVAMETAGDNLEDFCCDLGDKLQWVHYSDSNHMILGDGNFGKERLVGYVKTLEQYDYSNCLDLEINDSIYWEDPHSSIQRTMDYLRTFLLD